MALFELKVVTPERSVFDGEIEFMKIRTIEGDVGFFANHANYLSAVGTGELFLRKKDGSEKTAAVDGGFIKFIGNNATVVCNTCEWAHEIDVDRAKTAMEKAEAKLRAAVDESRARYYQGKVRKALNRIDIGSGSK